MAPLLVSALLLSASIASAQTGVIEPDRAPLAHPLPRHPALPDFSMQQRVAIYKSVVVSMKEHRRPALPVDLHVDVGTKLPETAELYSLPEDVRTQIAAANKYKYTVWNDQVLLVDPAKHTVADILHDYILRDYDKQK
jgi:hypothetical protein